MKLVNCIMLVDDNKIDNFFHERVIQKYDPQIKTVAKTMAEDALGYLSSEVTIPDIIILDINMPGMNGWEFIDHYKTLNASLQNSLIVVMLSSGQPDDFALAKTQGILHDFKSKPLTIKALEEIIAKYQSN